MVRENKTECKMTFRNEEPHVNKCFPRVRGDVPRCLASDPRLPQFSPRARGCSLQGCPLIWPGGVFPACAGMFRPHQPRPGSGLCFPRVRGDVPLVMVGSPKCPMFSPRARGCSHTRYCILIVDGVFPACAGMFRLKTYILRL